MKRLLNLLFAFTFAVAATGLPAVADNQSGAAPADEYFGRFNMSVLGIQNVLHDIDARIVSHDPRVNLGVIALTEDALVDWEHRYPNDSWLPASFYKLMHLYHDMATDFGHEREMIVLRWLDSRYPSSQADRDAHALVRPANCGQDPLDAMADPDAVYNTSLCADAGESVSRDVPSAMPTTPPK